jgi:hypothetical protein
MNQEQQLKVDKFSQARSTTSGKTELVSAKQLHPILSLHIFNKYKPSNIQEHPSNTK